LKTTVGLEIWRDFCLFRSTVSFGLGGNELGEATGKSAVYTLGGVECRTAKELAQAIREDLAQAQQHFSAGYIGKWLEEGLNDYDAKIAHDRIAEAHLPPAAIVYLAQELDPETPPVLPPPVGNINRHNLTAFLEQSCNEDTGEYSDQAIAISLLMLREGLTSADCVLKHAPELEGLEAAWKLAMADYVKARGQMLLYADIWNDPSGKLADFINDDREIELALARQYDEDLVVDATYDMLLFNGTAATLRDLLTAGPPYVAAEPQFKIADHPMHNPAMARRWFADLSSERTGSIGHQALLRDIVHIPSHESVMKELLQNIEPEQGAGRNAFEKLTQPLKAAALGVPLLILGFLLDFDSSVAGFLLIPLALSAATLVTLRCAFKISTKATVGAFLAIWFSSYFFFYWFVESDFYGSFLGALLLGAIGGGLGWVCDPLLNKREFKKAENAGKERMRPFNETEARLTIDDLARKFFPPRLDDIPMNQRQAADYRREAALGHGQVLPGDWSSEAAQLRRTGAAPNHGAGASYSIAGINVASDGTRTYEIVDGLSIDNQGGMNTRVSDGFTLHSDGKMTTNVTRGIDVRTDGQISADIGGARFSFGGNKRKTDDEWDWGTGQKKEKGWFD